MTYEKYGEGPWLVSIQTQELNGQYRFQTEAEAEEWCKRNGGKPKHKPRKFGNIHDKAAMGDGV